MARKTVGVVCRWNGICVACSALKRWGDGLLSLSGVHRRLHAASPVLASALFLLWPLAAHALPVVQDFFLPMPEQQIKTAFSTIRPAASNVMVTVFSLVATGDRTVVTYDQWEDGYETDLSAPLQASTRVWGDGNNANGICPGFAADPTNGLPAGTVITLRNDVTLPRDASVLLYDARDRVGTSRAITVSRACWSKNVGTVQASAAEVLSTLDHDPAYIAPVGEDVLFNNMFQYVGLLIMADQDGTTVTVDADGTGTVAATSFVLNRGETHQVNGGVRKGATVTGTKPIQVHMMTGNKSISYESRSFVLRPTATWDDKYMTAVGTAPNGNAAYVFLYSTNSAAVTVNYTTRAGSGTLTIPGGGNGLLQWQLPQNSGTLFQSSGGQKFFVICSAGAQPGNSAAFDWGFSLLPFDGLTTEAVVGWGPGSSDGTQNGSPAWVTPMANTTIYVDYQGDRLGALTDPLGGKYDAILTNVAALESRRVYEPDRDQTGMRLYTLDGTRIAAMWGEDPSSAQAGNPYLDMGTVVVPFPVPTFVKTSRLYQDNPPSGPTTNDVVEYTLTIDNRGLLPLGNTVVIDNLPASLLYVTNSTLYNGSPVPDQADATPFPLGDGGYTIPLILRGGTSVFTFRCVIMGAGSIVNSGVAGSIFSANEIVVTAGGSTNTPSAAEFTSSANGSVTATYFADSSAYLRVTDLDQNVVTTAVDTIAVTVRDDASGDYETRMLRETGVNSGVFTGSVPASVSAGGIAENGTLFAPVGSTLTLQYTDPDYPSDVAAATASILAPPPPAFTKVLYLSDPGQSLDRIDPAAAADNSTARTGTMGPSFVAVGTGGVVSVDATSYGAFTGASGSTEHVTGTGSNRLLLVGMALRKASGAGGTPGVVSQLQYGGLNLTQVVSRVTGQSRAEIWALVNPPAGSNMLNFTVGTPSANVVYGVTTFSNVNQTAWLSVTNGAAGTSATSSVTVASSTNELVYDALAIEGSGAVAAGAGQSNLWSIATSSGNPVRGAGSTKQGTNSVAMRWTFASTPWAAVAVSIKPGGQTQQQVGVISTNFVQAPPFALPFSMPSGGVVRVTNYIEMMSGSMPTNPAVSASLGLGSNTFLTLSNPTYGVAGGASNLTWSGALTGNVTVATNQSIWLRVDTAEVGPTFQVLYDSASYPSKILLPTTNVIAVTSLAVYDAPYPGTNQVLTAPNGSALYIRATVTDPFGSYDVSRLDLGISGPGGSGGASLSDASVVASNGYSKTYEYAWSSPPVQGSYAISATAWEGSEGVSNAASAGVQLIFTDFGTPSATAFTTGPNGPSTSTFQTNETVYVRVTDADMNASTSLADSVTATVTNAVNGDTEPLVLWETGVNSGIFTGGVTAVASGIPAAGNGVLTAPAGSILRVTYVDTGDPADVSGATATVPLPPGVPGLEIRKTLVSPASGNVRVGDTAQFNIQVINSGGTTQGTVTVVDTFPSGALGLLSATPAPDVNAGGQLTWNNVGPLSPGQQANISVSFTASAGMNPATNAASVAGTGAADTGSVVFVIAGPGVQVSKTALTAGPLGVGDTAQFEIVVRNSGNTTIVSPLPLEDAFSGVLYQYASSTPPADGVGAGSLLWNDILAGGTLAPNAAVTNIVNLRVMGGGNPAQNSASVNYAVDQYGNDVPAAGSTTGIVTRAASISGWVYYDVNTNGIYSTNDYGLGGVTLTLYADADGLGTPTGLPVRVVTTLDDGSYELLNLPTGRYVVVETDLAGCASTGDSVPPNDNRIPLNVTNSIAFTNAYFLDYVPPLTAYATVNGTVWNDLNGNGIADDGGAILANAVIDLVEDANSNGVSDVGEPVIQSVASGTNGAYSFGGVTPGNYVVRETDPFGWLSTTTNQVAITVNGGTFNGRDFLDRVMTVGFHLAKVQTAPAGLNASVGTPVVWTITVANTGDVTLASVSLTDSYSTNILEFVSADPLPAIAVDGNLQWADCW